MVYLRYSSLEHKSLVSKYPHSISQFDPVAFSKFDIDNVNAFGDSTIRPVSKTHWLPHGFHHCMPSPDYKEVRIIC